MSKYSNKLEQGMILKTVMTNFLCQLHWAMGCLDIWPNLLLGMSRRVFLDEVNIWIGRLDKADCLPSVGGPCPISGSLNRTKRLRKREFHLLDPFSWDVGLLLPSDWNLHPQLSWFSGLWIWTKTTPLALPDLQLAGFRFWDMPASIIM